MNLAQHPELLDRLAAAYALGTLRAGARRRFEHMARAHPKVRAAALLWQGRWSALSELQSPVQPDAAVWTRIQNLVDADRAGTMLAQQRAAANARTPKALAWWRSLALTGAVATVAAVAIGLYAQQSLQQASGQQVAALQTQLQTAQTALQTMPQVQYVAVLADGKAQASMLVTFDARQGQLALQRVGGYQEAADRSLQLWALPTQGAPQSLGVLGEGRLEQLQAQLAQVQAVPALAISLEPKGGVPSETGPTGPVLFSGALIKRDL
ncbi:MAG: anti-sigma factor [Comamonas sp.]